MKKGYHTLACVIWFNIIEAKYNENLLNKIRNDCTIVDV